MTNSSQQSGPFSQLRQWLTKTPDRALDQAYEAALKIRQLEDTHFNGNPISDIYGTYSRSSYRLLERDLNKYLGIIKRRMAEFRASSSLYPGTSRDNIAGPLVGSAPLPEDIPLDQLSGPAVFFTKLQLVDATLERYERQPAKGIAIGQMPGQISGQISGQIQVQPPNSLSAMGSSSSSKASANQASGLGRSKSGDGTANEALTSRTGVLPRSILRTVDRIKQDLDPDAEVEVIRSFRNSKNQTTVAITFLLQLIIVPLLVQYLSKNFIVAPLVVQGRDFTQADVFLNEEMEETALHELQRYEERFRFEVLIGKAPELSEAEIESRVQEKAFEIEESFRQRSAQAVENVFADSIAVLTFALLLTSCKEKVATLKGFIDEIIYGLSDSAKAFIIILFTDTFVGFHSPHGWEVLLEGLSNHLGLPANRNFIFLFIATFPVILDTVFKYWIFRYLNRISPSAVATYKNMNE
jgi:hypothetical protein